MGDTAQTMPWLDTDGDGDHEALDRVLSNLYHELHAMARRQLVGAHAQALDATALVPRSIRRDWNKARRFLLASLQDAPSHRPTAQALASQ